jgi:hypothetical protein
VAPNKLIAAGANRLKKAPDAKIDPAVPPELQKDASNRVLAVPGEQSPFAVGRVMTAEDVQGSPEEQLAFVVERLQEIDGLGRRAEDFVVLNKGALLEVAQQRELHVVAGHSNFAIWAGGVLDVEPKYVFELLADAARIRAIGELGPDLAQHLTRASARKVVSEAITQHGLDTARRAIQEGLAEAEQQGKKRPTAAILSAAVQRLTAPSIPAQEARSEISDPPPAATPADHSLASLQRAADHLRERVYTTLAPAAVKAALDADWDATGKCLDRLSVELERTVKRLSAARRAVEAHRGA